MFFFIRAQYYPQGAKRESVTIYNVLQFFAPARYKPNKNYIYPKKVVEKLLAMNIFQERSCM
jgi:hypothetical protein